MKKQASDRPRARVVLLATITLVNEGKNKHGEFRTVNRDKIIASKFLSSRRRTYTRARAHTPKGNYCVNVGICRLYGEVLLDFGRLSDIKFETVPKGPRNYQFVPNAVSLRLYIGD